MKQKASPNEPADKTNSTHAEETEPKAEVMIPHALTVKQLAELLDISAIEVIKNLMRKGMMANINQVIDFDSAATVAAAAGYQAKEIAEDREAALKYHFQDDKASSLKPRPAVVTIMGHVDHGKTSLLDVIRETNVTATEAGSITQHIGAYQVEVKGQKITFLDTPGHEAFTAMRARGAQVTDIAILVVAADDGVMPQTVEAIDHAKAAGVPIVVALNKIDKQNANPDRIKQQLADNSLLIEEWGGDVICLPVSAKLKDGITDLLENLLIVAEMEELKANPNRRAIGVVIEAKLDSSMGALSTVLVQTGTLKIGDSFVVGNSWGKVKAMFDDKGKRVRKAGPATPVEVLGFNGVPQAGDVLTVVTSEKEARTNAKQEEKQARRAQNLSDLSAQILAGQVKELNIVLKTDVQGSIEPIKESLERLEVGEARVRIIRFGSGSITESDVMLAIASKGIIIGFNTRPEPGAKHLADIDGVGIHLYQVIYTLLEDIEKALAGMLEPTYIDAIEGHAEVLAIFSAKPLKVAGVRVTDGKISRGALARVLRQGNTVHESSIISLKHFKDNVREMATGFECGVGIDGFSDFKVGDIIEAYRKEKSTA
ncbi:translation initiation factor IF-2 [Chloroflexota bacterium]